MLRSRVSRSVNLVSSPIWSQRQNFITVRQLRVCWCGALSLTRGWVCHLQLLLALAILFILTSESRGLMITFYCLRLETPPTWRATSPYLYPSGTGWAGYTPRHWVRIDGVHSLGFIEILYSIQSCWNKWSIRATDVVGLLTLRKEHEH
jgi:hypothetical protein